MGRRVKASILQDGCFPINYLPVIYGPADDVLRGGLEEGLHPAHRGVGGQSRLPLTFEAAADESMDDLYYSRCCCFLLR